MDGGNGIFFIFLAMGIKDLVNHILPHPPQHEHFESVLCCLIVELYIYLSEKDL